MSIEIAKNLDLDLDKVPINVLLPISVAANACGIDVAALGGDKPECDANNVTMATQLVPNLIGSSSSVKAPEDSASTEFGTADATENGATAKTPPVEPTEPTATDPEPDRVEPSVGVSTAGEATKPSTTGGDAATTPQNETETSPEPVTETSDPAVAPSEPAADASTASSPEASHSDAAAQ